MSDITCITFFLYNPTLSVSHVTIISLTWFTWLCESNNWFLRGGSFLYVIDLLPIFFKQFAAVIWGTGSSHNSKSRSSHTPSTVWFLGLSIYCFSLVQFSSFHHKVLFLFSAGSLFSLVTVAVSWSGELLAPDSMVIDSPKPTTNFAWTVTLIWFLWSFLLDFSLFGLMGFRFLPLFFLKYSWIWSAPRERVTAGWKVL